MRSLIVDTKKRIVAGETADVIILSWPVMDELQKRDKSTPKAALQFKS